MQRDQVLLLECNLDDMTGESLGYAMDRLLGAGALDVWTTPIMMKKSRPAVMLSVLCRQEDAEALQLAMLCHTTTLGVRRRLYDRIKAEREFVLVETPWGEVRCKVKRLGDKVVSIKPEYDDCAVAATAADVPLAHVARHAESTAWEMVAQ